MPYFDPAGLYVLWSSIYLLILGVMSFTVSHISVYRFCNCKELEINKSSVSRELDCVIPLPMKATSF